jgi:hypothetical protein
VPVATALLLAGCGMSSPVDAPVSWWHQLQGGPIADLRPPPPGVNDPFPNLGQIPKKPVPTDATTRQNIADALSADRTVAERDAAMAPIVPAAAPPPPAAIPAATPAANAPARAPASGPASGPAATSPAQPNAGRTPTGSTVAGPAPGSAAGQDQQDQGGGISASLDAASAPPPPPTPQSPPAAAAPPGGAAVPASASLPPPPVPVPDAQPGVPPAFAAQPPAAPALPGMDIPRQPAPVQARMSPPPEPFPPPPNGAGSVNIGFAPGSAIVPSSLIAPLRTFMSQRGKRAVLVVGRGEAVSSDPALQGAGLQLGLERARALAAVLAANGTPAAAIRIGAEAGGRGAYLRLVD